MSKGIGNFFNDVTVAINYRYLKNKSEKGCELSEIKLKKIIDPIIEESLELEDILTKNDENIYSNEYGAINIASAKFKLNSIKNLLFILEPTCNEEYETYKCIVNIAKVFVNNKAKVEDKLKGLAYLKLAYKYKFKRDYDFMDKMITIGFIAPNIEDNPSIDLSSFILKYNLLQCILRLLEGLTPRQVLGLFPIEKSYDGEKYQTKDYYSSIEAVNDLGIDVPLNHENAKEFLMECMIGRFMFNAGVSMMTLVSDYNNWDLTDVIGFMQEIKNKPHLKIVK